MEQGEGGMTTAAAACSLRISPHRIPSAFFGLRKRPVGRKFASLHAKFSVIFWALVTNSCLPT